MAQQNVMILRYPHPLSCDIWVDVIATPITHAAQAWLRKSLQDIEIGQHNPWNNWAVFRQEMDKPFTPMSDVEHMRRSLKDIWMTAMSQGTFNVSVP